MFMPMCEPVRPDSSGAPPRNRRPWAQPERRRSPSPAKQHHAPHQDGAVLAVQIRLGAGLHRGGRSPADAGRCPPRQIRKKQGGRSSREHAVEDREHAAAIRDPQPQPGWHPSRDLPQKRPAHYSMAALRLTVRRRLRPRRSKPHQILKLARQLPAPTATPLMRT